MSETTTVGRFKIIVEDERYVICDLESNSNRFNPATAYVIKDAITEIKSYYNINKESSNGMKYYTNIYIGLGIKEKLVEVLKEYTPKRVMNHMIIEKLTLEKIDLVLECDKLFIRFLENESKYDNNFKTKENNNSFQEDLKNENNLMYVAIKESEVIGFMYGYLQNKKSQKEPIAHISFLYIKENYRNKKVATEMINHFLGEMREKKINMIEVSSYYQNEIAKRLYNKIGFTPLYINYRMKID